MAIRETIITLGVQAIASARDAGATLLRAVRPGERETAPNFPPDAMAPWPQVDRYPMRLGNRLTFDYIGAAQRIAIVNNGLTCCASLCFVTQARSAISARVFLPLRAVAFESLALVRRFHRTIVARQNKSVSR
jgi:hypothetical protein